MIKIYTSPSCSSCRKAKKWLDEHGVRYEERNIFNVKITNDDINAMLKNADNGFDDIISTRSKAFKDNNVDVQEMRISELKSFIIKHPSVLKRPIIIDDRKMQVGYNDDDIRVFMPHKLRQLIMCNHCTVDDNCDYQIALKKHLQDIKGEINCL